MKQLIIVMIATGIAGGLAGYFISLDRGTDRQARSGESSTRIVAPWLKYVFLGITAAFIVPLFLSLAKSSLVGDLLKGGPVTSDIFVFAGFCLVAATSSRTFIQSISDRVLREAREARETAEAAQKQVEQAVDSITEPESDEEPVAQTQATAGEGAPAAPVSDRGKDILLGLRDRGYTLRSTSGLAKDTGIQKEEVIEELKQLNNDGLVRMASITRKGKPRIRWMITPAGRDKIF
jgi:hypothetical protein